MLKKLGVAAVLLLSSILTFHPVTAESPKHVTYIAIGDSLTAGIGSSEENYLRIYGFVPQFTKYLRSQYEADVENYGIPGLSSVGLLGLFQADEGLRNRLKTADIITVSIGGNDILQMMRAASDMDEAALQIRMQVLQTSLEEIHAEIKKINSKAHIFYIGLYNPYPSGHELHPLGAEYAPLFNRMIERFESDTTSFINPYDAFLDQEKDFTHIENEDIHPTDKGYAEIVKLMKKAYKGSAKISAN